MPFDSSMLVDLLEHCWVVDSEASDSDRCLFKGIAFSELEDGLLKFDFFALRLDGSDVCPVFLRLEHGALLIELPRHADHHAHAARPYGGLRSLEGAPQLPLGYPGSILMATVPPLWKRVMDPRIPA